MGDLSQAPLALQVFRKIVEASQDAVCLGVALAAVDHLAELCEALTFVVAGGLEALLDGLLLAAFGHGLAQPGVTIEEETDSQTVLADALLLDASALCLAVVRAAAGLLAGVDDVATSGIRRAADQVRVGQISRLAPTGMTADLGGTLQAVTRSLGDAWEEQ